MVWWCGDTGQPKGPGGGPGPRRLLLPWKQPQNVAAAAWGSRLLQGRRSVCLRVATMEAWPGGAGAVTEP